MNEAVNIPLSFPFSLKDFIAYQEKLSGRALSNREKEAILPWLEVINTAKPQDIELIDCCIQYAASPTCVHFLESIKSWINYVLERGSVCEKRHTSPGYWPGSL